MTSVNAMNSLPCWTSYNDSIATRNNILATEFHSTMLQVHHLYGYYKLFYLV